MIKKQLIKTLLAAACVAGASISNLTALCVSTPAYERAMDMHNTELDSMLIAIIKANKEGKLSSADKARVWAGIRKVSDHKLVMNEWEFEMLMSGSEDEFLKELPHSTRKMGDLSQVIDRFVTLTDEVADLCIQVKE